MNPLTLIPAKYRKYAYAAYALAVIVVGALGVAGIETGKAIDVLAYVGAALGLTAASNTLAAPTKPTKPNTDVFNVGH